MGRRHSGALPVPRKHPRSGNARVRIGGQEHWLGPHGSAEARLRYDELIAAWIASGRTSVEAASKPKPPPPQEVELPSSPDITVGELALAWIADIERQRRGKYRRASAWHAGLATAKALRHCASMRARDFGPRALQEVRRRLLDTPYTRRHRRPDGTETVEVVPRSRRYVNDTIGRVRQLFNWAVGLELIPIERAYALKQIPRLAAGQGRETPRRGPVSLADYQATLPHLTDEVRGLVEFIRLTGCRPSEAMRLRLVEVQDRDRPVWRYQPADHKNAHRGHVRDIPIGPRAQEIVKRHAFGKADDECIFDPRRSLARIAHSGPTIRLRRKCSSRVGATFTANALRVAIHRASKAAGVDPWTPYQLRYLRLREIRRDQGAEAARATAGHARESMTAHYAPPSFEAAARAAMAAG